MTAVQTRPALEEALGLEQRHQRFSENWQQMLDGIKAHIESQPD